MTDIVERLRRYVGELCICTPVELEAADEIERLRAEVEHWRNYAGECCDDILALTLKLEAAKSALRQKSEGE